MTPDLQIRARGRHRWFAITGALLGSLAVAAGAFGAHGLKSVLSEESLVVYETAVRYQMYHAVALITCGLIGMLHPVANHRRVTLAGWLFLIGTALFSGSLYVLAISGLRWIGAFTPFGGIAFICGWLAMGLSLWKRRRE